MHGAFFIICCICIGFGLSYLKHKPEKHWLAYGISLLFSGAVFLGSEILLWLEYYQVF